MYTIVRAIADNKPQKQKAAKISVSTTSEPTDSPWEGYA
jgi:hypothetical protein